MSKNNSTIVSSYNSQNAKMQSMTSPCPTPQELVQSARDLRQKLRDGQIEAENAGRHPVEVHNAFVDAGFYKILVPKRFGGFGYGLEVFFEVGVEISRGDPGVGWNYILGAGHTFHLCSFFPEHVQEQVLGGGQLFISPMRQAPPRPVRRVEGGYILDATWDYCSGSSYATHAILGIALPDGDGTKPALTIVPRSAFEVLPDWGGDQTLGMRASGSNSIRLREIFVSEDQVVAFPYRELDLEAGSPGTVGYRVHGDPLFLGRTLAYYNAELVATQIGCALAAADEYEDLMRGRNMSFPPRIPRVESPDYQRWFGQIRAKALTADSILRETLAQHRRLGERWRDEARAARSIDDVELRARILEAAQLALSAVDMAFATAGTSAVGKGSRMQKYYRDAAMYRTHIAAQFEAISATSAAHYFGAPLVF